MPHAILWVLIGGLVGWSIYRRVRRTITFQPLQVGRFTLRIVLLVLVSILYLASMVLQPTHFIFAGMGILLGIILAYFAIRTTKFERREERWFYRPNRWIGSFLVVLFLGRIVYRVIEGTQIMHAQLAQSSATSGSKFSGMQSDPLTATTLFTLVAFYVAYFTYLLLRKSKLDAELHHDGATSNNKYPEKD